MCFRKKDVAKINQSDRDLINYNSKTIDVLVSMSNSESFINALNALKPKLKYLIPSTNKNVIEYDKKIKNLFEDMKIVLSKNNKDEEKSMSMIKETERLIAERNRLV
jgi:hypothetical protein